MLQAAQGDSGEFMSISIYTSLPPSLGLAEGHKSMVTTFHLFLDKIGENLVPRNECNQTDLNFCDKWEKNISYYYVHLLVLNSYLYFI